MSNPSYQLQKPKGIRAGRLKPSLRRAVVAAALGCLIVGLAAGLYLSGRGVPFVGTRRIWAIGVYASDSPLNAFSEQDIRNPVLTAGDVTDVRAKHVADPFMVRQQESWYMFFEVINQATDHGDIGLATSQDGLHWDYAQIVLDEPFHLSYPYVFEWEDAYYMLPETGETRSVRLYKASDFPRQWSLIGTLLEGDEYVDASIFRWNDDWWLFASTPKNDTLYLYTASELVGPWTQHPASPVVVGDANIARPAGRVLAFDGRIFRYTQDDKPVYGNKVRVFEITTLTPTSYQEELANVSPIVQASGDGWNGIGMHHIDPHQVVKDRWLACTDGYGHYLTFGFEY
jgi:hypothetical protein